jgi:hypothetical protein
MGARLTVKEWLDRLEAISKILLILGTLATGLWVIVEYLDKKSDARVAETLGYARRFSTDPLQAAQTRIGMAWYAARASLQLLATTPVRSADEFAARRRQLVMMVVQNSVTSTSPKQTGIVSDLDLLVGFFAELHVCITSKLCDRETANNYFQSYARRLYCLHEPFIQWKDQNYSRGYGNELRTLAALPGNTCAVAARPAP